MAVMDQSLLFNPMTSINVIHGPNLNMLGQREPDLYGLTTLDDIHQALQSLGKSHGVNLSTFQSNHEGEIIDHLQQIQPKQCDMILLNPAALTHTSIALRDALLSIKIPFIEVHISNIFQREPFRHHSYFSDIAIGTISGFGAHGYILALHAAIQHLELRDK